MSQTDRLNKLDKAKRRGTLTKDDEKNLPYDLKLKCGKAGKGGGGDGGLDFRSLLKHVKAFSCKLPATAQFMVGDRIDLQCMTSNEVMTGKWTKNGRDLVASGHIKLVNQGSKRKFIVESCILSDDCTIGYVVGEEKTECEVFVKDRPVSIIKPFEDMQIIDGDNVTFKVELSVENGAFRVFYDGQELRRSEQVSILQKGFKVELKIRDASFNRAGFYTLKTNGDECMAELIVEEKPIEFSEGFQDLTVNCDEVACFECSVSADHVSGNWYKDQKEIREVDIMSGRIRIVADGKQHKIIINDCQLSDIGEYEFRVVNENTDISMTACLNVIELVIIKPKDPPKICLNLAAQGNILIRAGSKLAIDVVICRSGREGRPSFTADQGNETSRRMQGGILYIDEDAKIKWTRQLRGDADGDGKIDDDEYLDEIPIGDHDDKCRVDTAPDKTTMVLMRSTRADTGLYRLYVKSEAGEDSAVFKITVIDRPDRPGQPQISELTGEDCMVDWTPPEDDGGCTIKVKLQIP